MYATYGGSMIGLHFTKRRPRNATEVSQMWISQDVLKALNLYMRLEGIVYISEHKAHFFLTAKHETKHIEKLLSALESFLIKLKSVMNI